ncbi:SRPBCC family protein [Desertivirga xinjiangensis]|uniref:SRPBCC family protein n=1 Tax=Desertivirga xinjiangensis TaxID=539206 RepID=UPI00210E8655|nr:SRPBCC family protein [Pedobacter xinjiangensis]
MPLITLETKIKAPREVCFDLARSIDLHQETMQHTNETAIAGVTSGLIGLDETVTWCARHFGVQMELTSKITQCIFPQVFIDEMLNGPFKKLQHTHRFEAKEDYTLMVDEFQYESPLGLLGRLADRLFLKKYMKSLLQQRNARIKQKAEITLKES